MNTVTKFWGKVNSLGTVPEPSYVTLKSQSTNESYDTSAVTEKLLEKGIDHVGCEFEITIEETRTGELTATLLRSDQKPINPVSPSTPEQERILMLEQRRQNLLVSSNTTPQISPEQERILMLEQRLRNLEALLNKQTTAE